MRKIPSLIRGTLGLALAASVFFGCQDFLGEDKGEKASARAGDGTEKAQADSHKDSIHQPPAKDLPGKPGDTLGCQPPKPDTAKTGDLIAYCKKLQSQINAPEAMNDKESLNKLILLYSEAHCPEVLKPVPPPPAPVPGTVEECKYLWSEVQTATGQYLIDVKHKYVYKMCDKVLGEAKPPVPPDTAKPADPIALCKQLQADMLHYNETGDKPALEKTINLYNANKCPDILKPTIPPPPPPVDSATRCANMKDMLATMDPASPKYPFYSELYATDCAVPSKPAPAPASEPVSQDTVAACKNLYSQMLSAAEPQYGHLKDAFTGMHCLEILNVPDPHAPPPPPPDHATQCKAFREFVAGLTPDHPKYLLYQESLAKDCADVP